MDAELRDWQGPRETAVPELVDAYGDRLLAFALRITRGPEEAESLVQDTFLQAYSKWRQFEGRSDPERWLFAIASRLARRRYRRRAGEPTRVESIDDLLSFDEPALPDVTSRRHDSDEASRLISHGLAALPPHFRMPLVLKDVVGLTIDSIARVLDLNVSTVRTRIHRGRLKLRAVLTATLPRRSFGPTPYSRAVCMDLLQAKQDALDRNVDMPGIDDIICERCRAVFASLDLTRDACRESGRVRLSPRLREGILTLLRR